MDDREGGSVEQRRDEDERDPRATREAEEAHGGSMAPSLVDDTGHPVAESPVPDNEPSALGSPDEDGTGS
ncbi:MULTISPECIES: GTPase activator [Micromonospora]|uniref:GTPase activator n=1 Tax=Micromonospora TaxID=1873 RepID=UPI000DEB02D6|nr:GTPase activator [Micromonospora sp. LHW51205]RBQ08270.1 GTPase activator [Micromonospora sp. LHW51205]